MSKSRRAPSSDLAGRAIAAGTCERAWTIRIAWRQQRTSVQAAPTAMSYAVAGREGRAW